MSAPLIHGNRGPLTASRILKAVGLDLGHIRSEDTLSWADAGRVLGKSEDQAAKYADGTAEMGVTAYIFGREAWGTRFTGRIDALLRDGRGPVTAADALPDLLHAAHQIATGLKDGVLCRRDLHGCRKPIEEAIAGLQGLLQQLGTEQ